MSCKSFNEMCFGEEHRIRSNSKIKTIPPDASRHGLSSGMFFENIHTNFTSFFPVKREKNRWQNFFLYLILPSHVFYVPNSAIYIQNTLDVKDKLVDGILTNTSPYLSTKILVGDHKRFSASPKVLVPAATVVTVEL